MQREKEKKKIDWVNIIVSSFTIFGICLTSIGYLANAMSIPIKKDIAKNSEKIEETFIHSKENRGKIEENKSLMLTSQKEMLHLINLNSKETLSLLNKMNVRLVKFSSDSEYTKENVREIKEQLSARKK